MSYNGKQKNAIIGHALWGSQSGASISALTLAAILAGVSPFGGKKFPSCHRGDI
jgi:hypothetical protein